MGQITLRLPTKNKWPNLSLMIFLKMILKIKIQSQLLSLLMDLIENTSWKNCSTKPSSVDSSRHSWPVRLNLSSRVNHYQLMMAPKLLPLLVRHSTKLLWMKPKMYSLSSTPHGGHCKSLAPKWTELAEKVKDDEDIIVAKIDATANDSPSQFGVTGFPTIYWAPKGNKQAPKKYSGGREVTDFAKFLKDNASSKMKTEL